MNIVPPVRCGLARLFFGELTQFAETDPLRRRQLEGGIIGCCGDPILIQVFLAANNEHQQPHRNWSA